MGTPARLGWVVTAAAILVAAAAACTRPAPAPSNRCDGLAAPVLEVRDGQGVLEASLRPADDRPDSPGALLLCDAEGLRVARVSGGAASLELTDLAGHVLGRFTRGADPRESSVTLGDVPYRIYDDGVLLGFLDAQGVPIGRVGQERDSDRAIVYNPGSAPIGYAQRRGDQRVVRGTDDAVAHHVLGVAHDRAAALLALPKLDLRQKLALARYVDLQ